MKPLRWTVSASNDMLALQDFLFETNAKAAARTTAAILKVVAKLREVPQMGRPGRVPGTREIVVARTPFLVWYRERDLEVQILRVIHGRMKWPPR